MDWNDLSLEMRRSAKVLLQLNHYRSSVNRSYYAAYAAATGALSPKSFRSFPKNWSNPTHEQLPALIEQEGSIPIAVRRKVKKALRRLSKARIEADYKPNRSWFGSKEAHAHFHEAIEVMEELGVRLK